MPDETTLSIAFHRQAEAAFAAVKVPRVKVPYTLNYGSGHSNPDWFWCWRCPCCPYFRRSRSKPQLMAEIDKHRCKPRESLNWHPRYRTPPRRGHGGAGVVVD